MARGEIAVTPGKHKKPDEGGITAPVGLLVSS